MVVLLLEQKLPVGVDVSNNEDGKEKDDEPEKDEDGVEISVGGERSLYERVDVELKQFCRCGNTRALTGQTVQPAKKMGGKGGSRPGTGFCSGGKDSRTTSIFKYLSPPHKAEEGPPPELLRVGQHSGVIFSLKRHKGWTMTCS